jgi:hypothetical protein
MAIAFDAGEQKPEFRNSLLLKPGVTVWVGEKAFDRALKREFGEEVWQGCDSWERNAKLYTSHV